MRHANFPEADGTPELSDCAGHCRGCGGYSVHGLLCDACRDVGWTDIYGIVEEPDNDGRNDDDEIGWREYFDRGYGPDSFARAMSKGH